MSPRDPLDQALAAGTGLREYPELAAIAPAERFSSSDAIGADLAKRVVAEMDKAGREGFDLDQPPRRQGPSLRRPRPGLRRDDLRRLAGAEGVEAWLTSMPS
jgi:hypothetical protein